MTSTEGRHGSLKFRLADWGRKQRSGSRGADHLLMHLTALCNASHRCTLSDSGIASYFGLKKRSVTRHLGVLREKGLIRVHFEGPGRTKRIITFSVTANESHIGAPAAPKWRSDHSQNGGQNPEKNQSGSGRALPQERRPVPYIPATASPWDAAAAYGRLPKREGKG